MLGLEQKVARAARMSAALGVAGAMAAVGLGLLTVAAWIVLAEVRSTEFAALVLGLAYLGLAAVTAALALRRPTSHSAASHDAARLPSDLTPLQLIVLSFMQGFEQGRENRRTA